MDIAMLIKSIFVIILVLTGFILAFWVMLSGPKIRLNQLLFTLISLTLLYCLTDYFSSLTLGLTTLFLLKLTYSIAPIAVVAFYFFARYFPCYIIRLRNQIVDITLVISTAVLVALTFFSNLVVGGLESNMWGGSLASGPLMNFYYLFLVATLILTAYDLIAKYQNSSKLDKKKIGIILIGALISVIFEVFFNIILPIFKVDNLYYLGDYSIIIFFILTSYATVKNRLFDVKLAVVRSVAYIFVLVSLACLYLDIVFIISGIFDKQMASPSQIASGVVTSLILAFVFQPLKRFFDKVTNKIFYKDNYDTDDFFTRVNESLTTTTDLRNLLERISHEIGNTLKSEQTFFYINTDDEHYVMAGTQHHRQLPKADADKLGELCGKSGDIVIASMLEPEDEVRRLMLSHRIELILPLIESNNIIGYLCLGEHRSNSGYTNRDVKALNAVSDEIAIAIQNALAVQEIREFNSTLQQRIENATKELRASNSILRQLDKTKDEFVGMASHQLRTPLTSVKGYISMVLEGDAGKVSDMQRKFLEEAFMSSERMVRLIDDFLNVSRIQNGKFIIDKHEVDLSKVVEQEIESLAPSAKMRNMKFVYNPPSDFPMIKLDEGKIRQVIMNFADNALYYSRDNTKIVIDLSVDRKDVVFTVKDTGIGVPISEQAQLFTKFYRASNARKQRPDGTGVGLYLAKKVIDAHGGEVIFLSIEGKGSMFGFRLPIDQVIESTTAS